MQTNGKWYIQVDLVISFEASFTDEELLLKKY